MYWTKRSSTCMKMALLSLLPQAGHPHVCLLKNLEKSPRFCTDYRKTNAVTKPDAYHLPWIEGFVDRVGSAQFVSTFDLLKGYLQIPLTERAEISSFITPPGLFSYTVMSFGLRSSPATFQRLMNMVVAGLEGCILG